jgi:hypothetical protein
MKLKSFKMFDSNISVQRHREKFTNEEDKRLLELIQNFGVNSWDIIASLMPNRNIRQVRERWKHYLSCNNLYEPWKPEEDALLYQKVSEFGFKWTKLTRFFPGRSDIQLQNRWTKLFGIRKVAVGTFVNETENKREIIMNENNNENQNQNGNGNGNGNENENENENEDSNENDIFGYLIESNVHPEINEFTNSNDEDWFTIFHFDENIWNE